MAEKVKIRIEAEDRASATVGKVESRFKRFGASIKANALKITAVLATVVVAFRQMEASAASAGQERALSRNLAAQGVSIDEFISKLKDLSDNQIATNDLVLASNRALALGIQAQDLPGLMTVAANAAVELGLSTTQAFNDITTGIGRASPLILDNLGIVVDATAVYAAFAASIGVSTESLSKQQKTIALTKAVVEGASNAIEDFETRQDSLTRSINRSKAAMDNVKTSLGSLTGGLVQMVTGGLTATVLIFTLLYESIVKVVRGFTWLVQLVPVVGGYFEGMAAALKTADDGVDGVQQKLAKLALDLSKGGVASIKWGLGIRDAAEEAKKAASKIQAVAEATEEVIEAQEDAIESTDKLTEATAKHTAALKEEQEALKMTLAQFEALRKEKGEQITIDEALAAGARLTQGGTRIRFDSTGSRLVNQGSTSWVRGGESWISSASGGTFSVANRVRVLPDGRVEFV